jgi:uncharacterized protein (DUF934 family)
MPLVKGGRVVTDRFVAVADDAPVPVDGAVIVPAARFLADRDELFARAAPVGVAWPNSRPVAELAPHVDRLALIALAFPTFKDGRAYSQARLLRERFSFRGELRATGDVLRDQFVFMLRAGFDAFEVKKDADAQVFAEVAERYSVFYQPAGDEHLSALQARLQARAWRGGRDWT